MTNERKIKVGFLQNYASVITVGQRVVDAMVIVLSLYAMIDVYEQSWRDLETIAACLAVIVFHSVSEMNGLYRSWRVTSVVQEMSRALVTWACTATTLLLLAFMLKRSEDFSRVVSIGWFVAVPNVMIVLRLTVRF